MNQAAASTATMRRMIKFVKVITPQSPVNMAFVSMVLGNSLNLTAEAVAGLSVPLNLFTGYLPVTLGLQRNVFGPCARSDVYISGRTAGFRFAW